MFELPEIATLARQMNEALLGKTIRRGQLGNSPPQVRVVQPQPRGV
jgi:formamidopyrimidine-DNA glycosylase